MDMTKTPAASAGRGFSFRAATSRPRVPSLGRLALSKGRASPNKPQRRCCNKGAAAHASASPINQRGPATFRRSRLARGGLLHGCGARGQCMQEFPRSTNALLIFAARIGNSGIDGWEDRAGHGIPLHVMNGTAPNPWEGWASTGKVENRYIPIGTAEAVQAWLAPVGRRSQAIANEDKNLCSVPARYVQGFHTSIVFSMALKTMAQSVPMAASSKQGRNYKSEFAYGRSDGVSPPHARGNPCLLYTSPSPRDHG